MNYGRTLREVRESKGLSMEEVATKLGVTTMAVSLWETDKKLPSFSMATALASLYGAKTPTEALAEIMEEQNDDEDNS